MLVFSVFWRFVESAKVSNFADFFGQFYMEMAQQTRPMSYVHEVGPISIKIERLGPQNCIFAILGKKI